MTAILYPKFKQALLSPGINLATAAVKAALVDTGMVSFSAAHEFLSDISTGIVGTPVALANKSFANGVFDADNVNFMAVPGPTSLEALVLFIDTGTPATSRLMEWHDEAPGLPVTSNGGDIPVNWSDGASKIFAL
ncbi:hypothetical protein [Plastoroseomonas hellenica]|uniref:hypothetical protein n=1 Tax=Plastoroseomonas hellenica TaxID=2687306 RepID=UPI001BAD9787|nr:hypothetical protein [Plastoroseomonas hellenica]MBR0643972.1 hypothetical protein [Plastoroseomonas hellenica]